MATKKSAKETVATVTKAQMEAEALKRALVEDPNTSKLANELEKRLAAQQKVLSSNVLNDEIAEGVEALCARVTELKDEINHLYSIEAQAEDLTAMVNSHNVLLKELEDELNEYKKNIATEKAAVLKEWEDKISAMEAEFDEEYANLTKKGEQAKAELKTSREREEEEYKYNRERSRAKEDDAWEDEKNTREQLLAAQEAAVAVREQAMTEKEAHVAELESIVANLEETKTTSYNAGYAQAEKDQAKSEAIKQKWVAKSEEAEKLKINFQIETLQTSLDDANAKIAELEAKLDSAYTRIQELATQTVQANGGVKILSSDKTDK